MKQCKPVVIGYVQIEYAGKPWVGYYSINPTNKWGMMGIAEADFERTGIKSKFRPVYA